jgi:hypothetical protein
MKYVETGRLHPESDRAAPVGFAPSVRRVSDAPMIVCRVRMINKTVAPTRGGGRPGLPSGAGLLDFQAWLDGARNLVMDDRK